MSRQHRTRLMVVFVLSVLIAISFAHVYDSELEEDDDDDDDETEMPFCDADACRDACNGAVPRKTYEKEIVKLTTGINMQTQSRLSQARLVRTMESSLPIWGIATIGNEAFLVREGKQQIDVYDSSNFTAKYIISVPGLGTAVDMVADNERTHLYISDSYNNAIHRVCIGCPKQQMVVKWPVKDKPHGLSINALDGHVLVTFPDEGTVKEYTKSGTFVRRIQLEQYVINPWHTVLLTDGESRVYLVTHGVTTDRESRACLVNSRGLTLRCLTTFLDPLGSPIRAHVVGDHVIVADTKNHRVLMMTKDLKYVWTLATELNGAMRMWFDDAFDRLYVIVNIWDQNEYSKAEITIFEML